MREKRDQGKMCDPPSKRTLITGLESIKIPCTLSSHCCLFIEDSTLFRALSIEHHLMVNSSLKGRFHVFTVRSAPRLDLGSLPLFAIYSLSSYYVPGVALASGFQRGAGSLCCSRWHV